MRQFFLQGTLVLTILCGSNSYAQDFSNKGKDFWVAYGYHQVMIAGGNQQNMVLYFATDQVTNITINIPGTGYSQTLTSGAGNNVLTSLPIPKNGPQDARLLTEGLSNKGIHITSDKPMVTYAHIYNQNVSGATILFPTNTLGKEYYSINYKNTSNSPNANCFFYVVAADTGITKVEIKPSANTTGGWIAGNTYTVTLTQGQVYNVMGLLIGTTPPVYTGADLTGSKIQSIASASGACKKIAVFSGSGRISITCDASSSSSDNYMVQAFPKTAWGKKYLTVPAAGNQSFNLYRVCVSDPTTVVKINGVVTALPLLGSFYYEIAQTNQPQLIEADKPVTVAQYFSSQGSCGNGAPGDPEMIYLSPVEQNINKVLWNATPNYQITLHYFNVVIPNTGTAVSSFRLDGAIPASPFIIHPQDAGYVYLKQSIAAGFHVIQSDSGFNSIAYGFGNTESYGYNGGTNIRDIFQYISIQNLYGTVNFPATCNGSPFYFSMTFPYQPSQIQWTFGPALNAMGIADVLDLAPVPTSTIVVGGKTLYVYKLPTLYTITAAGVYPIKVTALNPTPDGCGGIQEIDYDVQVFEPPMADFNFSTIGCVTSPVSFTDNSNTGGRAVISRYWNFGDAGTSTVNNPSHTYAAPGAYNVKYSLITDIGCLADTAMHIVTLNNLPVAQFGVSSPYCAGKIITFNDLSVVSGGAILNKWTWNFGDGSPIIIAATGVNQEHTYATPGVYTVTLLVETTTGCQSNIYSFPVTIHGNPVANFSLPTVCLPAGAAQFNDLSTIAGGGESITGWAWNFGDAGTSISQNPLHNYLAPGPYNVSLTVTSNNGCTDIKTQVLTSVYAEPQAAFTWPAEVCLGNPANFIDNSVAAGSSVTQWHWDFGDATTSISQNPVHTYTSAGTYTVLLNVTSAIGCQTINNFASHTVIVKPLPTAGIAGSTTVCLNAPSPNITFTGLAGTVPYTFTYNINGGANQTVTTIAGNTATLPVPTTTAGTFTYNLVNVQEGSTAMCSNAQSGSSVVTVNPLPTASIAGTTNVCLNAPSPNITFTGALGTAPYTFIYNINGGANQTVTTAIGNSVTVAVPTTIAGIFTYNLISVKEGSLNLCSQLQSGSVVVNVRQLPTASISGSTQVCLNAASPNVTFTGAAGSAPYTFIYKINGGANQIITTVSGNSITIPVPTTTAGVFTYSLSSVQEGSASLCGQAQAGSAIITVNSLPTSNFNFSAPSCETRTITFTDASIPNAGALNNWQWDFGDPASGAANTSALQSPTHVFANAGIYTVKLTVGTDKGCVSAIITKQVTINVRPKAGFISPEICLTDLLAPFVDTSRIAAGSIVAWDWNFGDPNATPANPNTSILQNPFHRYTVVGPYTATLIVTSNNGCTDTIRQTFTVNGSIPIAGFTVQNQATLCSNQDVNITDASTVDFGSIVNVVVYWDFLNDPTIKTTEPNPVPGELYTHTYPEFGNPATKTVRVKYMAYSGINCVNSLTKDITLLATPTLQFDPLPFSCDDAPAFQITQAQLLNGLPGAGVFSGPGVTPTGLFSPSVAGTGLFIIRYTYTGTNGCSNYKEQTIAVYTGPVVNAGPDKVVLLGGSVTLTPTVNGAIPVTYLWSPATFLNDPTIAMTIASPPNDITYTLTVTSDKGCTNSDQVFVKVLKAPQIPNIFSPNGDGVHDTWVIAYLESYPGCTVDVYNRYGQLVYHSLGYSNPWDGKVNGKDVPVGTYYYIVDPKNGRAKMAGYVDVIR